MVKVKSKVFQLFNKQIIKDNQIKTGDLETILKDKAEITELDKVRKIYYRHIEQLLTTARKGLREKNLNEVIEPLKSILKVGFHAYDLDTVLSVLNLRALVYVFFDQY